MLRGLFACQGGLSVPRKPKRPCGYSGCPELVVGRYCEKHKKMLDQQYNRYQRDPSASRRYDGNWRRIREAYITAHPLCETCRKAGRLIPAREVHHVVPLKQGGTHDPENLMSLCTTCHSSIIAREGGRWRKKI